MGGRAAKWRDSPPPRGTMSALLDELARAPERDFEEAWDHHGLRAGDVVRERFELVRELGRGGFGVVFEARDRQLRRDVAFKAIRPGPRERSSAREELLRSEAEAVAQLQHPNIVTLHDLGRCDSGPYLILELLRGETLGRRLQRGPVPVRTAVSIAADVARALAHAHGHGVLHRDLKPGNVFLAEGGGVKVLDFGLAHVFGAGGPAGSGTPGYMAPEQLRGGPEDARTDVFALGVLLHEMLTGHRLFPDSSELDARSPLRAPALEGQVAPPALAHLVARMVEADPARRPRDAAHVLRALVAMERAFSGEAHRARRRAVLIIAAVVVVAAAGMAYWIGSHRAKSRRAAEAYRDYFSGVSCAARPVVGQDCGAEFRKAIARDPTFALAHYQLAVWSYWNGGARDEQRTSIHQALRYADGVPAKEGILIRAWSAYLDGRLDEALALYEDVTRRWPEDTHAWTQIADILRRRGKPEAAIPALERAALVDPESGWPLGCLAECLGVTGQLDRLRERVREWESAPRAATLHALSIAYGWLGDVRSAADAAERGVALGAGHFAQEDRLAALVFADDYTAGERGLRALAAAGSGVRPFGVYGLAALDAYRGRRGAGLEKLDALRREVPAMGTDSLYRTLRIDYLLGDGRPDEVWREISELRAIDPSGASEHAPALAWLGDLDHARELAAGLRPDSPYARIYEALVVWRGGDIDGALDRLRQLERAGPCATWRVAPVYLHAEIAAAAGRDAEAIETIQRFHAVYVPVSVWRSWAYPRSLVLLARSQERLGQRGRARETLDRFLALWSSADPADPLLAEARAARARLAR